MTVAEMQSSIKECLREVSAGSTAYMVNPSLEQIQAITTTLVPSVSISAGSYANLRGTVQIVADTQLGQISHWDPLTVLRLGSASDVSAIELSQYQFETGEDSFLLTPDSLVIPVTNSTVKVVSRQEKSAIFPTARRYASSIASNSMDRQLDVSIDSVADAPGSYFPLSFDDVHTAFDTAQALTSKSDADVTDMLILTAAYQVSPRRPVRTFIERAGICGRRTFFRRFRSLYDNGWVQTDRTRIGLGRPITQLLTGQRVAGADSIDDVLQEYIQAVRDSH